LLKTFDISENKILYIQNFVDTKQFQPIDPDKKERLRKQFGFNKNDFIVAYVGRFIESKGIKYILQSFKKLSSQYSDIKLVMAGYGVLDDHIKHFIKKNNLNNIRLLGHLNHSEIAIPYSLADVFIITSIKMEGSPMSIFEAMSCGLPVISTKVGGLIDILKKSDFSINIEEADSKEIENAILKFYNDREMYETMSRNALKCVLGNYSNNDYYLKILDAYRSNL
jgi:glycosyltransferase involved in cell wall biosynthesis